MLYYKILKNWVLIEAGNGILLPWDILAYLKAREFVTTAAFCCSSSLIPLSSDGTNMLL